MKTSLLSEAGRRAGLRALRGESTFSGWLSAAAVVWSAEQYPNPEWLC
ncbi:hypothetical protein ACTJOD_26640 [Citrobacter freundii]